MTMCCASISYQYVCLSVCLLLSLIISSPYFATIKNSIFFCLIWICLLVFFFVPSLFFHVYKYPLYYIFVLEQKISVSVERKLAELLLCRTTGGLKFDRK